jgi:hypothetical protein
LDLDAQLWLSLSELFGSGAHLVKMTEITKKAQTPEPPPELYACDLISVVFDIICRRYFGDICRMPSLCNDNRYENL